MTFRNIFVTLVALLIPGLAFAGVDAKDIPSVNGKGIIAENGVAPATLGTGGATPFVGVVIYFEADDTSAYTGPTAATLDTGTEACAVFAMTCADVWTVTKGADADLTDSACATDVADGTENLAFCY